MKYISFLADKKECSHEAIKYSNGKISEVSYQNTCKLEFHRLNERKQIQRVVRPEGEENRERWDNYFL